MTTKLATLRAKSRFTRLLHHDERIRSRCRFDGFECNLDGDLSAVLAKTRKISLRSHWPFFWRSAKSIAQAAMIDSETHRDQRLNGLADEFLAAVTEELFGLVV